MDIKTYFARKKERKAKNMAKRKIVWSARPIKATLPELREKLENITHLIVKLRDKSLYGVCRICRENPITLAYHLIPAGQSLNTRYDLDNIVGACLRCNGAEHYARSDYAFRHNSIFGLKYMDELYRRAKIKVKWGREDF
ncbi:MAG: hypothetical protein KGI50_07710, partial [Patescibacteria group bacterium]|nr:hypothetical protein [Patescibacteria group bacterium]